jgi:TonB family protein
MQTRWKWWWIASLAVHATLMTVAATAVPARAPSLPPPSFDAVNFEAPTTPESQPGDATGPGHSPSPPDPSQRYGGAHSAQNLSSDNPGERGDGRSLEAARRLATRSDGVNLDARQLNALDRTQEQRIRTSRERASPQDDRRTPNPADDPWVARGHGILLVRMTESPRMPGEGALVHAGEASNAGDPSVTHALVAPPPTIAVGSERHAGAQPRLAAGLRDGRDGAAQSAAPTAFQRPAVDRGHASTTADQAALRPDDDTDAALLAASLMRAHVNAAAQEGPARAAGVGGVGGGGSPGSGGGLGRGGVARAFGDGDGVFSLETGDARYVRYFGQVRRRIYQLTERAFPFDEALRLNQGTVIVTFTIERDGRVRDVAVQRRSGIERYDTNVRNALASASMPPIPASLGRDRIAIRAPVEFLSPVVR